MNPNRPESTSGFTPLPDCAYHLSDSPLLVGSHSMSSGRFEHRRPRILHLLLPPTLLLVLALSMLLPSPASGRTDPTLQWNTLKTPHFWMHYYPEEEALARQMLALAEEAYDVLKQRFGFEPGQPTHLVLVDDVDDSNGFAQNLPYNLVTLYSFVPDPAADLGYTSDWRRILVYHELTHIFHLEQVDGILKWGNWIFGKTFVPNSTIPSFLVEGIATYTESTLGIGGRIHSPMFDMYLRLWAAKGGLFAIDEITGSPKKLPRGNSAYLYGSYFIDWIMRGCGYPGLTAFIREQAGKLNPYSVNISASRHLGGTLTELYRRFSAETTARFKRQMELLEAAGLKEGTDLGFVGEAQPAPHLDASGSVWFYRSDGRSTPILVRRAADGTSEEMGTCRGACDRPHLLADGSVIYSSTQVHEVFSSHQDLMRWSPGDGKGTRLTFGRRAKDPAPSPDGSRVAYVRTVAGTSFLEIADTDGSNPRVLFQMEGALTWPAWSPDGTTIAVAARADRPAGILLVDTTSGASRPLLPEASGEIQPCYTPDGAWLVYSSARSGVFNLWGTHLASGRTVPLTNVLGGAFAPALSHDGQTIVYAGFQREGWHLYSLQFEPESPLALPDLSPTRLPPAPGAGFRQAPPVPDLPPGTIEEPYAPFKYLYPRSWRPSFLTGTLDTANMAVDVTGTDPVGIWSWTAAGNFDIEGTKQAASLTTTWLGLFPSITGFAGFYKNTYLARISDDWTDYYENDIYASIALTFPFPGTEGSFSMSTGYAFERFRGDVKRPFQYDPGSIEPYVPVEGNLATLYLEWVYDDTESYAWSVATEKGTRVGAEVRLSAPPLGSNWTEWHARVRATRYTPMPWSSGHMLMTHYAGGYAEGRDTFMKTFTVGGYPDQDIVGELLAGQSSIGGLYLRGYPSYAIRGSQYHFLVAQYTMPLWYIRRGFQTLPVFIKDLYLEVFGNGAGAFDTFDAGEFVWGVGGELKLTVDLAYYRSFTLAVGVAHGFQEPGGFSTYFLLGN